jgi:hypothetical protein
MAGTLRTAGSLDDGVAQDNFAAAKFAAAWAAGQYQVRVGVILRLARNAAA